MFAVRNVVTGEKWRLSYGVSVRFLLDAPTTIEDEDILDGFVLSFVTAILLRHVGEHGRPPEPNSSISTADRGAGDSKVVREWITLDPYRMLALRELFVRGRPVTPPPGVDQVIVVRR
jgi:hypothetical protein